MRCDTDIRAAHSSVWDALQFAWHATFHSQLSAVGMEKWPTTGPHAFNDLECRWLTETLLCLKKPATPILGYVYYIDYFN